jgi:single-stranded DNA-binding protein
MPSVLVEGTPTAAPVRRTSAKGSVFVTARMRASADHVESVFCSVIAFHATATEALARLAAGDTVAIAGPAAISRWEKSGKHRAGLKVTTTRVLSVYEAGMRRKAASPLPVQSRRASQQGPRGVQRDPAETGGRRHPDHDEGEPC